MNRFVRSAPLMLCLLGTGAFPGVASAVTLEQADRIFQAAAVPTPLRAPVLPRKAPGVQVDTVAGDGRRGPGFLMKFMRSPAVIPRLDPAGGCAWGEVSGLVSLDGGPVRSAETPLARLSAVRGTARPAARPEVLMPVADTGAARGAAICTNTDTGADPAVAGLTPVPVTMTFTARPAPETRVTAEEERVCDAMRSDVPLHHGVIRSAEGFTAPSDGVLVSFSADGMLERVYVPGVFDAVVDALGQDGAYMTRAAATPPIPGEACVTAVAMEICAFRLAEPDTWALRPCDGTLPEDVAEDPVEEPPLRFAGLPFVPFGEVGGITQGAPPPGLRTAAPGPTGGSGPSGGPTPFGGTVIPTLFSGPPGPNDPPNGPPGGPNIDPPALPPVPLPAAGWLMLAGLGGLAALRRRRRG